MSYAELAGLIANGTVRKLTPEKKPFEWIRQVLQCIVRSFQDEKRKEKQETEPERRRQMYEAYVEARQVEHERGNEQLKTWRGANTSARCSSGKRRARSSKHRNAWLAT